MVRLTVLLLFAAASWAQTLTGEALVKALRQGGFVIVMRHASSPQSIPPGAIERQLDDLGRSTATAMGQALRERRIPVHQVESSPTYRALETVRYAQFGKAIEVLELGDDGRGMAGANPVQVEWLKQRVIRGGAPGTNDVVITHLPNLRAAFPNEATNVADGEALIFSSGARLAARVKIEDWPKLPK